VKVKGRQHQPLDRAETGGKHDLGKEVPDPNPPALFLLLSNRYTAVTAAQDQDAEQAADPDLINRRWTLTPSVQLFEKRCFMEDRKVNVDVVEERPDKRQDERLLVRVHSFSQGRPSGVVADGWGHARDGL
jgi:hypothetical protein